MRKEYDLKGGKPNPYAKRLGAAGRAAVLERFLRSEHFVRIDDDLVETFGDEQTVNATLRLALRMKGVLAKPKTAAARSSRRRSA
jgi:hypothetical protein